MERAVGIIPARLAAARLPGKLAMDLGGIPVLAQTLRRARQARSLSRVLVSTDSPELMQICRNEGVEAMLDTREYTCGSDRVAGAAEACGTEGTVVNIQGDEALLEPGCIDSLVGAVESGAAPMSSAMAPIGGLEAESPDLVKVVCDSRGNALYFSRAPIPFLRDGRGSRWGHIGIYAFRRDALRSFAAAGPSELERAEGLEQLRALQLGWRIGMVRQAKFSPGINTLQDLQIARRILADGREAESLL
jgi:3-deoxy-D-manno-octulosonate cytidylyltransferase